MSPFVCLCECHHLLYTGAPNVPPGAGEFASREVVKVELERDIFMLLQQGHGGWNDKMAEVYTTELTSFFVQKPDNLMIGYFCRQLIGKKGVIHHINDSGDLLVVFSGKPFVLNPAAVVKVSVQWFASQLSTVKSTWVVE